LDHKTGGRINNKEKRDKVSPCPHISHILRRWGFKQKVPRKVHVNTASHKKRNTISKKGRRDTCGG